jgi:hypothetical protein
MKEGWVIIFNARDLTQAKLVEDVLKQNGVISHIISSADSAIPSIGSVDVYTLPEHAEKAKAIIKEHQFT